MEGPYEGFFTFVGSQDASVRQRGRSLLRHRQASVTEWAFCRGNEDRRSELEGKPSLCDHVMSLFSNACLYVQLQQSEPVFNEVCDNTSSLCHASLKQSSF